MNKNNYLIFLMICTNIYGMEEDSQAFSNSSLKKNFVELYNHELTQESEGTFYQDNLNQTPENNLKNELRETLYKLNAKNISKKEVDSKLIKLALENCPNRLKILIKKFEAKKDNPEVQYILPTRILLEGPSGSGKSLLAQIIAKKAKPKTYFLKGTAFANEYQNSGAQNLNKLFEPLLKLNKKVAIIIDELTALGKCSSSNNNNRVDPEIIKEFWMLLDKCDEKDNILVIATANEINQLPQQIKTRFAIDSFSIDHPQKEFRLTILKEFLPEFGNLCYWQKYWYLYQTSNVSIRELRAIIRNVRLYKEDAEKNICFADICKELSNFHKSQKKYQIPISKKIMNNLHWIIPTISSILLQQQFITRKFLQ
ncbi:MAG: ATP-binding protein [Candidatus Babeliales bacterium]